MLYPASLLLAGVALPLPLAAQAVVQPLPGTTDADRLADLVRQIGRNPRDVTALVDAGDLSAKLGDTTAAASLYKRASQVDPNNARVQAGIARILVNGEHPGEALRYFGQAERAGLSAASFADDRGLAYDLIGEQERAQRDYRLALARPGEENEDEVRRRYALSLGISGRKDEALKQIDTLLRKSDRGAWRARAFILAMNGDAAGANKIATTMMPAGMAGGLAAFFTRLPTLSPTDRAFAVHFGEVTPTPERVADARLVPPLPALAPDSYARPAGVQVASQNATPARVTSDQGRGRAARRANAAATLMPTRQVAAAATRAAPPQSSVQPVPARPPAPLASPPVTTATQVALAAQPAWAGYSVGGTAPSASTLAAAAETRTVVPASAAPMTVNSTTASQMAATPASQANAAIRAQAPTPTQVAAIATPQPTQNAAATSTAAPGSTSALQPSAIAVATPASNAVPAPVQLAATTTTPPAAVSSPQPSVQPVPTPPTRIENEDTILARIVANITVPASELGVAPMPNAAPQPGTTATIDEAARAAENSPAVVERRRERVAAAKVAPPSRRPAAAETSATEGEGTSPAARRRAVTAAETRSLKSRQGKAKEELADAAADDAPVTAKRASRKKDEPKLTPKQAAAKAKADAKAVADAKAEAAEKKAARAQPERYWVQVAGGATQGDLHKAWKNVRGKSSLLASRAGYTTPLRATNRVVTGPFKTQEEAQAMVNRLSKDGVSAFTFTSEAGQKMTKLGDK